MKIRIDFFIVGVRHELQLVRNYLKTMEEQLTLAASDSKQKLNELFSDAKFANSYDRAVVDTEYAMHHEQFGERFPKYLRYSFIVLLFSFLETWLPAVCDEIKDRRKLTLRSRDLRGNLLNQVKTYLKKLAQVDVAEEFWRPLYIINAVRDCIVHTSGDVTRSRDRKQLEQETGRWPGYLVRQDCVVVEREFCEFALESTEKLINELFRLPEFGPEHPAIERDG